MADFEAQVMGLTGLTIDGSSTAPSQTELSQFLKDGVIDVTNRCIRLRPQDIDNFQRESATIDSNSGLDVGGAKIISVIREAGADGSSDGSTAWEPCGKISASMQSKVVDIDSLHYASQYHPKYIIDDNGKVNVYPVASANNGYKVFFVNNVPTDETNEVALVYSHSDIKWFPNDKVHLVVLYAAIQSLMAKMTSLNSSLPSDITLPVLPVLPSMNATTVSIPSFTAPDAFVQPVAPVGADIDFSSVPTAPSYIPIVLTLGATPTISDLTISAVSPVVPSLTDTTVTESSITEPSFIPPVMSAPDFGDTNTWISTEEDSEMLVARVQEIQAKIGEYSARMGEAQAQFNKDNAIFQKDIQIAIQNAQIESAEDGIKLQKFGSEVQKYQAEVNTEVQEYQQNLQSDLQVWQAERTTDLQKYGSDIQDALNSFNKENAEYQAQLQISVQDAQLSSQDDAQKIQKYGAEVGTYQHDMNKEIQDFVNTLQKETQEYQSKVALYNSNLQKYQAEIGEKTAKVGSATQNAAYYSKEADKYYQWANAEVQVYIQNNSKMINKTIAAQAAAAQQQRR